MLKSFRFIIMMVLLVAAFFPGFAKLQELKWKLSTIENSIRSTQLQNAMLEAKIARMKNQDDLEIVAREKMGVVKKGETVIKIIREGEEVPEAQNITATNTTRLKQQ